MPLTAIPPRAALPAALAEWLAEHADAIDDGRADPAVVLPALAGAGLPAVGVPQALGGAGGDVRDAVLALAAVAEHSLAAAFVYWGHRAFIEYVLQSPRADALAARWLPRLLSGELAGATGLSNAMKFLAGIEQLQISATAQAGGWRLDGQMPWVTNLRPQAFVVAAAVSHADGRPPSVVALESSAAGLVRSADLDLIALRSSNTAQLQLAQVPVGEGDWIDFDARRFLPRVRPAFLGLQCGLAIGLARASLRAAAGLGRAALQAEPEALGQELDRTVQQLLAGLADGRFVADCAALFRLRIALGDIAQQAVQLELQAAGGRAYLQPNTAGFARRWREAAFVPIVTPSVSQLRAELRKQAEREAA